MRDLNTVTRGETVHIRSGLALLDTGAFIGVVNDLIVVDLPGGVANVPLDSPLTVEDENGHVLGVVVDEPVLTGTPPERE